VGSHHRHQNLKYVSAYGFIIIWVTTCSAGGNEDFLLAVIDVEIDLKTKTHIFIGRGRPFHEHHSSVVVTIALDALQNVTVFLLLI
jgi:hypothetical protein